MIEVMLLLVSGTILSAFFSGSETGFYRVSRLRLLLDGLDGDWIAKGLLWLTNHPSLFVATTLIGNNVANYVVSLAIVLGTQQFLDSQGHWPQIVAPVVLAPLLFVYGELLPKNVFFEAPNRLLRRGGAMLLICSILFLPISGILWAWSKVLEWFVGESPQRMQLVLARRELERLFEEGHEIGVLGSAQSALAQTLLDLAGRSVTEVATSVDRVPCVQLGMRKAEVLQIARQNRMAAVPVEDNRHSRKLIGYLRVADLYLASSEDLPPIRPLVDVPQSDTYIAALMRLQGSTEMLGRVVTPTGDTVGYVTARQLGRPLLRTQ